MAQLPMSDRHETVLPAAPDDAREALSHALAIDAAERKIAVAAVVEDYPWFVDAWSELATLGYEPIERYAYARVGYHRGLDALRGAGWGGRGYVRWAEPTNRGFLTCLVRLRNAAQAINEVDEVDRINAFLEDLDPAWDESNVR